MVGLLKPQEAMELGTPEKDKHLGGKKRKKG